MIIKKKILDRKTWIKKNFDSEEEVDYFEDIDWLTRKALIWNKNRIENWKSKENMFNKNECRWLQHIALIKKNALTKEWKFWRQNSFTHQDLGWHKEKKHWISENMVTKKENVDWNWSKLKCWLSKSTGTKKTRFWWKRCFEQCAIEKTLCKLRIRLKLM